MRQKICALCGKYWSSMHRIKYKEGAGWVFLLVRNIC